MSTSKTNKSGDKHHDTDNAQTLEHLLSIVSKNREQRCAKVRDSAFKQAKIIIKQSHSRVRKRMHHHVLTLRDKNNQRISAAQAHNQTLIQQQQQQTDQEMLDNAWPVLYETLKKLWDKPAFRSRWISTAIDEASNTFIQPNWCIEHPATLNEDDQKHLQQSVAALNQITLELDTAEDIKAGIRIIVDGTVFDATIDGLLQQKTMIESMLMAALKQAIKQNSHQDTSDHG
jgi:hypothetical protein